MLKNVQWWNELGGCHGHKAVIWRDKRTDRAISDKIQAEFTKCFDDVTFRSAGAEIDGWPQGANYFMRIASGYLQNQPEKSFLWMEPDAIPLIEGWMDKLETEYVHAGKPFMGDRVEVENIPLHMSGVGIYWNPLHERAGEAYRAHEVAWDMAAKDQIVPQAHFTRLIEHAWKHPQFTNLQELQTQIRPETVLFHSSKDGSLIDLLRQKRGGTSNVAIHDEKEPATVHVLDGSPSPLSSFPHPDELHAALHRGPVDAGILFKRQPVYDIFIRTYPLDYPWLQYCLRSIIQYTTGFRKVWIVSPEPPIGINLPYTEWKEMNEESEDGYLSQQIHKLYADHITNYEPDYILHIDSDTLFTRPVTPLDFFQDGKLIWYYTPYERTETPWKTITEKFMKVEVKNEFMRRLPMMMPRWLYDLVRKNCLGNHGLSITDYIKQQPYREFSEFNVLGAVAWIHYHDKFEWVNTLAGDMPEPFARQFFSWGGITEAVKVEIQTILSGGGELAHGEDVSRAEPQAPCGTPSTQISSGVVETGDTVGTESAAPLYLDGELTIGDHVRACHDYSKRGKESRKYVMRLLKKHGLIPQQMMKK